MDGFRSLADHIGYSVNDRGVVLGPRGRLKPYVDEDGYQRVSVRVPINGRWRGTWKRGSYANRGVHQLVLEAFVGPCPPGHQCLHKNNNPADNRWPENIRWGTHAENQQMIDLAARGRKISAKLIGRRRGPRSEKLKAKVSAGLRRYWASAVGRERIARRGGGG